MSISSSRVRELRQLETQLTDFLTRALKKKEARLGVLEGINELDEIARSLQHGMSFERADKLADWVRRHDNWKTDQSLRPGDRYRVRMILSELEPHLPAANAGSISDIELRQQVQTWLGKEQTIADTTTLASRKLELRRPPEEENLRAASSVDTSAYRTGETVEEFAAHLQALSELYKDLSGNRLHLISVLDDSLRKAERQFHREGLHLAAAIIYYLKLQGYLVEPFVTRLKTAERLIRGTKASAAAAVPKTPAKGGAHALS